MATTKVIDMAARSSSALAYDDYLYLTGESPNLDEKMQASVLRDYTLQGVKTSANSGLAQTSTPYATSNPDRELSLDVDNLTAAGGGTASVTDYIAIEQGAGTKKLLVGDLPFASSASSVSSVLGGTNISVTGTGTVTVNLDATLTGLTSVTSTDFVGALTGNADTATTAATVTGATQAAITSAANLATIGTITTGVWNGTDIAAGYLADTAVTPGSYTSAAITVDQQGRITAASSGSPGDITGVTAGAGLTGGGTSGTVSLAVDVGIADDKIVQIDSASVADNDYAKFTANGLEGRNASETKTDLSLNNVENTALSTWAGTTNVTTLGTIATGTWEGTTVALDQGGTGMTSIAKGSVLVANAADTLSAASGVTDGHVLTYTSSSDTVGWAAPAASGDPAGTAVAMAIALGG